MKRAVGEGLNVSALVADTREALDSLDLGNSGK